MITRQPRPTNPEDTPLDPSPAEDGPFDLMDVLDVDINIGPGETLTFVVGEADSFDASDADAFVIKLAANEERITITRPVRWWSVRTRKQPVKRSLDPVDTGVE